MLPTRVHDRTVRSARWLVLRPKQKARLLLTFGDSRRHARGATTHFLAALLFEDLFTMLRALGFSIALVAVAPSALADSTPFVASNAVDAPAIGAVVSTVVTCVPSTICTGTAR